MHITLYDGRYAAIAHLYIADSSEATKPMIVVIKSVTFTLTFSLGHTSLVSSQRLKE